MSTPVAAVDARSVQAVATPTLPVIRAGNNALMANTFADVTEADGSPLSNVLSEVFRGRIDLYFEWLAWGIKVQWGTVFPTSHRAPIALLPSSALGTGGH